MKILLADSDDARRALLCSQLALLNAGFSVVELAAAGDLLAEVERLRPDVVLVDIARPDRDGLDSLPAMGGNPPVVMFLDDEDPDFMRQALGAGWSSYHARHVTPDAAKLVMRIALEFFARNQAASARLRAAEESAAHRRTIDAAKRMLMRRERMSEAAAHRFMQRRAMDRQKRMAEIAAELLAGRSEPGREND